MAEAFDAYHKWLSIPPDEQPPDHYRLLGVRAFEEDPEVIAAAADRQMMLLRTYQTGPNAPLSQRLLNEVAAARICLLNAEKKAVYDQQLRKQSAAKAPARKPPVVAHAAGPDGGGSGQETADCTGLRELGEYLLLEKRGHGGMGEVYKAVHTEMDRVVAVKVLPPGHLQDERAVARFKREIKAVASLSHPNIVQAHDAREIEGTRFLVMEYVEGLDLRDVAKRLGPLPFPEACELILQAALGLQCAHEHGLVHRDIKPGNLMLTERGVVKLLDLGLARAQVEQGTEEEVTGTGEAMGTADYMAPEQAADSRSVDIRADLYSLGCTLYRLVAGRPPFSGPKYNTAVKKLLGHIQDPVPPIAQFRPDVPKRLEIILGRLLAKDPAKRLHAPAEAAEALAPLAAGSDLAALYARALGKIPAPPPPEQAHVATQSSQSSGLTQFFDRFKRAAPAPPAPPGPPRTAAPDKKAPAWLGYAAIGAVALLIILAWGVWSANKQGERPSAEGQKRIVAERKHQPPPEPPGTRTAPPKPQRSAGRLLLQWPADQRGDAMLEIDDRRRDVDELVSRTDPQTLDVELKPGAHKVWIVRRGYEPIEQTVTLEAGKLATVRPQWKKTAEVAVAPQPQPKPAAPKPPEVAVQKPKPPQPKIDPAIQAREDRWRGAMAPVEKLTAAWDFAGAEAALGQVRFDEPELTARLARRAEELKRMAALKAKMIARLKAANPRLRKFDLMLRGMNGDVTGADDQAIHARLGSGKNETHPWADMNDKARPELLKLAIDQTSPDDWLAGGLMAFSAGDVPLAEKLLDKARSLGADIDPYLGSLASASFAQVQHLLENEKWSDGEKALMQLQDKYGTTPWFAESKGLFDAALAKAKSGIYESDAEKLYAEAAKLFEEKELFDVRDVIRKLKADYPQSHAVTDTTRKPPFAAMDKATANLGKRLIVRQDGKGEFKSIQAAVDASEPSSTIQIQDAGLYNEKIRIPRDKSGLTLTGMRGCWPIITWTGDKTDRPGLLTIDAVGIKLVRLVLFDQELAGRSVSCIFSGPKKKNIRTYQLSRVILAGKHNAFAQVEYGGDVAIEDSLLFNAGGLPNWTHWNFDNCVFLGGVSKGNQRATFKHCTVIADMSTQNSSLSIFDCIVKDLRLEGKEIEPEIGNCMFLGASMPRSAKNSMGGNPDFSGPFSLDFRLGPKSACRGKASDGGDIGCRYTPEMIEMCKIALALRARGIIKF